MGRVQAIRQSLWLRVSVALTAVLGVLIGLIIWNTIRNQIQVVEDLSKQESDVLATAIEGSVFDALAVGDNETVREQFVRLKENLPGLEIHVFDFGGHVAFTTRSGAVGEAVGSLVSSEEAQLAVQMMLETGDAPEEPFRETVEGRPFLSVFRPIHNERRCHHCHGSSKEVLGGIHVRASTSKAMGAVERTRDQSMIFGVAGMLAMAVVISLFLYRMVSVPIRRVLDLAGRMRQKDLTATVDVHSRDEIAHMCNRMNLVNQDLSAMIQDIASASAGLAEAASAQAAGIEETSANLKELASLTKQNADSASTMDEFVQHTNGVVHEAGRSMEDLHESMALISQSSEEIIQVNRVIEQIAFQTNLLALNAAVEAARAGEAGTGFAVVADEVRGLALQASEAAKNTGDLIEGTVHRIQNGSRVVAETSTSFDELSRDMERLKASMQSIHKASQEQQAGIEQINRAVQDLDSTTQQNASRAEELAVSIGSFKVAAGTRGSADSGDP